MPAHGPNQPPDELAGLIIVDKPAGMTSHDVVARVRRLAGTRRVGHGGTLDPMATGVLVIGVGRATRLLTYVTGTTKGYTGTIRLGQSTTTDDAEGEIITSPSAWGSLDDVTDEAIRTGLAAQTGDIWQVPSAVSAIKVGGRRAYQLVRRGESVDLAARPVTVGRLDVRAIRRVTPAAPAVPAAPAAHAAAPTPSAAPAPPAPSAAAYAAVPVPPATPAPPAASAPSDSPMATAIDVDIDVTCSAGTYIRAIARDLGTALGVGGHLTALRRTAVGEFSLAQAVTLGELAARVEAGQSPLSLTLDEATSRLFARRDATAEEADRLSHGGPLPPIGRTGPYAVFDPSGDVIAIVAEHDGAARPKIVLR
jgi:tRNA pseudouridine55 synthase